MYVTYKLSVLDRSRTRLHEEPSKALRDTVAFAQQVEDLGYHRFWVSEHHSVPGVAGSAPTVLAAAVAAATSRIRVGTGGVMLPNHRPLVVAEQFGVLASLFPGRIDMGLGRSVGFTDGIRRALGVEKEAMGDFEDRLAELARWFTGAGEPTPYPGVHALPAEGLRPPLFVLANEAGADVAARAGAALVIGGLKGEGAMAAAVERYRAGFVPSAWREKPYVMVAGNVAVAETRDAARRLLVPEAWALAHSRTHGAFPPLRPAEEIEGKLIPSMSQRERGLYDAALRGHIHGTEGDVTAALDSLVARTGADEVLVTTSSYDRDALLDSYRRLATATRATAPAPPASPDPAPSWP
ncbi:MsnO8 family LLM class oxidoreductase [Streptomyces luteoverticillatus]|uniref:MsnO8 family LLM class oxidoreductase n=1 Tax=Streptomyces luteoverticillatus TaxID=66425 RepID=A0A3S9PFC0_STRLT|nr:MsnO8 family LLM class oxidoreductase [Streptomyces luteoverticillatus]AZQ71041.1 MsnO8 family LLM class oxidoreductase [Streptomyces luteoverticillatus]